MSWSSAVTAAQHSLAHGLLLLLPDENQQSSSNNAKYKNVSHLLVEHQVSLQTTFQILGYN